ncbi:MAG: diphosphate--fructose-6-phosphate 1-phosphotransferase [Deltaproteobacteria bacterium]|nr:diphosphate--fructose-6-phosphate 1-phosphotransferase [Deltaproteobacteria bacterium]
MTRQKEVVGILVGGGPAPGINGVISAVALEAINKGKKVVGIYDGFKGLLKDPLDTVELSIDDVSRIHLSGGSALRTSRENPTKEHNKMAKVLDNLKKLDIKYLVTIGGDDTAFSSSRVAAAANGEIKVAHVPKTIDNDLPLPGMASTFGFQTARHVGVNIMKNLMEDSRTTSRWYVIVAMGRKAGHLALGIGKASGATCTIIPEEFKEGVITLNDVCDIIEGSMIKRKAGGKVNGVVVLAEGLAERFNPDDLADLKNVERDEHGHIRLAEVSLGKVVKEELQRRFLEMGEKITIVTKDIGYELRCAPPIPFDAEYTRDLGFGAITFLLKGGTDALITMHEQKLIPIPFDEMIDPMTGKTAVRMVDVNTESYAVARKYMIRLETEDFRGGEWTEKLAAATHMSIDEFKERFGYLK